MLRIAMNQTALVEVDLGDLSPEIRSALAALAGVENRYEIDQECLKGWQGPEAVRQRLLDHLEARHKREREPLVQRLAELHQGMTTASMLRNLPSVH